MTLNDLAALVEKNSLACDNPNSRDMLATDGSQDRKYLTLADETRATAFQTVLRPLEDRVRRAPAATGLAGLSMARASLIAAFNSPGCRAVDPWPP